MPKCTFSGMAKLISVNEGETSISIKADVYSAWKDWMLQSDNAKYLQAMRTIGGDPTIQGQFAGDMYFLMNGWKLQINLNQTRVSGILYSDDFETAYYDGSMNPLYPPAVSSLVTTVSTGGGVAPTVEEIADEVWTDPRVPIPPTAQAISDQVNEDMIFPPVPTPQEISTQVWLDDPNAARLVLIEKIVRNKLVTNRALGTLDLYDDNGTLLFRVPLWEDAEGTIPYRGQGAERRERLE